MLLTLQWAQQKKNCEKKKKAKDHLCHNYVGKLGNNSLGIRKVLKNG